MKICIFTETYYPVIGGGETQAKLLAEGIIDNGHSVLILTRRSEKALSKFEQISSVPVYRIGPTGKGQLKKWGLILTSIVFLIKLRSEYDIIFVSGFRIIGISAVIVGKLFHKKCILKADSQGEMSGEFFKSGLETKGLSPKFIPYRVFLFIRNLVLRNADAFTSISDEIAQELSSSKILAKKIHRIPNGVDTRRFFPVYQDEKLALRKKLGLPQTSTIIIYTGRLVTYKGLPLLVNVWKEIQENHNDVMLLLVGTGGLDIHNCENELHDYVHTHHLETSVRFTGGVQNVPEYLQASDIFVFPTKNDAFGSSLVEAMACGLPVVTTPVGAIKTIVKDHENGLMIQPGERGQLYTALNLLIQDKTLSIGLGQSARKTVQEKYSSDVTNMKYTELFHMLIA